MPPWSVAAPLAGLFPGTSSVPATFLESVPSLKLTLVFPTNEQSKLQFLSGGQASQSDPNAHWDRADQLGANLRAAPSGDLLHSAECSSP